MELNAEYRMFFVAKPHDLALFGFGGDLQAIGEGGSINQERVVTSRHEGVLQAAKNVFVDMMDKRGFAVHDAVGAANHAVVILPNALMPQTDP